MANREGQTPGARDDHGERMSALSAEALESEIRRFHVVFVDWFAGRVPAGGSYFHEQVVAHLAPDFIYVDPSGSRLHRDPLVALLERGYGSNPAFEIDIEDVVVRFTDVSSATVCYVEVQRGALNATSPENRRFTSALFVIENGRRVWKHVHETWLPK